ncbi:DUF397 domain-containing protein [Natronosporangium hydrolyticum]|uniref:DUF397 domain-containing protein n=1 Tax=Natronosporangium hydrolyticum TaxID=2811111 RepID=A0A895YFY4_9ACTN|nr:DUF397 domain-containing protein [Natronosporangium hydrolyticum]QSB16481.1 DUF397 domain-containing protein [Natronosporangium hydrolyticum]
MSDTGWPVQTWRKSSRSSHLDCVEVARAADRRHILVRDSKCPDGPQLSMTCDDWRYFVCALIGGLDPPAYADRPT